MAPLKKTTLALLLAALAGHAAALDLTQAYQAALEQDATIRAARATADAGREALPQARAQLLPNLSASLSRNNNQLSSTTPNFFGQPSTVDYSYPSRNDAVTLRQPLYRSYQWAQYRQAEYQVEDANNVLAYEEQNLPVRVAGAYFDALLAQDQLGVVLTQRQAYETQLDAARKLFAGGSGTRTDVDDAQARLDMTRAQELEARQNVDYTRRELEVLVNQPVDKLALLAADRLQLSPPEPNRLDDWLARAEANSPELKVLRARLEAARLEVDKQTAGHKPTLDAVAQWSRSASENMLSVTSSYENRMVGLQLNVPIYAGGGVSSAVRQALAAQERATQQLEATRRDLGVRVHKEFRGVTEGVLRVQALEQALVSAEQALLSSQKSLLAGSRTRVDVLNAEANRATVLRDLAQARYTCLMAGLRLQALVGDAGADSIAQINQWLQP